MFVSRLMEVVGARLGLWARYPQRSPWLGRRARQQISGCLLSTGWPGQALLSPPCDGRLCRLVN